MAHKVVIPEDITEPGKEFLRSKGYEVVVVDGNTSEAFEKEAKDADLFDIVHCFLFFNHKAKHDIIQSFYMIQWRNMGLSADVRLSLRQMQSIT